jgi:hypothetical protein
MSYSPTAVTRHLCLKKYKAPSSGHNQVLVVFLLLHPSLYSLPGALVVICLNHGVWQGGLVTPRTKDRKWVAQVETDSTHPPAGIFKKNASAIACSLASRKVSPKVPQSGMRMLNYFINRAGRALSTSRRAELERAKSLLSKRIRSRASRNSRKKQITKHGTLAERSRRRRS